MVNQNDKAANPGDNLKHPPIPFLCQKTAHWSKLTFAETHAGRGVYFSKNQTSSHHIKNHYFGFKQATSIDFYTRIQKSFYDQYYSKQGDNIPYCGSSMLAKISRPSVQLRLCEWDLINSQILESHIKNPDMIRNDSFHNCLDWLTENDHTILLCDPFTISLDGEDTSNGNLPWLFYERILQNLSSRNAIVLLWFWSQDPAGWLKNTRNFLKQFLCFQEEDYHYVITGFGEGMEIVKDLQAFEYPGWLCKNFKRSFYQK